MRWLVLVALALVPACDPGGPIKERMIELHAMESGPPIVGFCGSACTMEIAKRCVSPTATFYFHPPVGATPEQLPYAVHGIAHWYPPALKAWWLDGGHEQETWMTGSQVIDMGATPCTTE